MTTQVLFAAKPERWIEYQAPLARALKEVGIDANLATDIPASDVEYIVYAPNSPVQDFSIFPKLKAVLNLWAGVETIAPNPTLKVPLARMVDHGLTQGMKEWVTGHVLRHHLGMDAHIINPDRNWVPNAPPLAEQRPIAMLGLGELGAVCAQTLASLGFPVSGWSRNQKNIDGVNCFSGNSGLQDALSGAEIVVLLLPNTPATENVLNASSLGLLAKGAAIINPGRGPLIDDDALLEALESGQVGHATLDVFRTEPLPRGHPFWTHPNVTVTPHIASETRTWTASQCVAENVRRGEAGEPFLHLVDRSVGY
ncbi:MAG: glyoxylate/hydroxypyruvate reductase A [Planktotalea sp.]|uniref:2-hydroxyacid dehydrogenase n=1 Tax=Planktotalea sp. TaxID=2029877 RepID=UPI003C791D39